MGEVWEAEQTEPVKRRVALKLIKHGMDTSRVIARFEAERQALALMDHPSIAKVFDAGATPRGRPYFVMERVQGVPITEHCDRNRLSTRERLALFVEVCEGVQHAHQKAIIHRDLKPSNVLVTVQGGKSVPKIIDFGLAKAISQKLTEKTLFTELGALIGTPEYMSPEQAEMTGQDIDTRTDVYALGVILYQLLVGALPFDPKELRSAGFAGIVRIIREEEPRKPSTRLSTLGERSTQSAKHRKVDLRTLQRQLRGDLDWIVMKALEKDRTRRYGSPAELAADVVRHMNHEPVLAGPPSQAYRAGKFVRRHRVSVSAAGLSVLAVAGFAVTMAIQARRIAAEREASDKVSEFLANMLGSVKPQDLGAALWKDLHERVAEVERGRGASPEQERAAQASLDVRLAGVNATGTALRLLDEQVLARAGQAIERELGQQPRIAGRLEHTLGETYRSLGLYGPAEQHSKRAAEIRERILGKDDPETLDSMNNLANVYWSQGRYPEAEKLQNETLEIRRRILGKDHPDTLNSMHNLGNVYASQGRYAEAERLYEETLEIQRRVLSHDHPDTLASMNNLANDYASQGRYAEAEKLYKETLEIRRRVLGQDHPDTLSSMNNLAGAYTSQGRYAEAEKLYEETLEIQSRVRSQEHPDTLVTMNNLANAYASQGRYAEGEKLYKETLAIRRRVLGPDHPDTLNSMNNLGNAYEQQGRYAEAERLHRETLEIKRRVLGQDHPDTLNSMTNLANAYASQGRYAEAEELYEQTLETQRRGMGQEHPDTLVTMNNLALAYTSQVRYAEAEKLYKETLEIKRRVLGQDHPDTLMSVYNLGCLAALRGDRKLALDWLAQAVGHGWRGADGIAEDDDLKSLRGDPLFEALVARTREDAAQAK